MAQVAINDVGYELSIPPYHFETLSVGPPGA